MVFLSYSSLNIKEATYIYTLLEKNGIDVWFAPKSIANYDIWKATIFKNDKRASIAPC